MAIITTLWPTKNALLLLYGRPNSPHYGSYLSVCFVYACTLTGQRCADIFALQISRGPILTICLLNCGRGKNKCYYFTPSLLRQVSCEIWIKFLFMLAIVQKACRRYFRCTLLSCSTNLLFVKYLCATADLLYYKLFLIFCLMTKFKKYWYRYAFARVIVQNKNDAF